MRIGEEETRRREDRMRKGEEETRRGKERRKPGEEQVKREWRKELREIVKENAGNPNNREEKLHERR